MDPQYYLDPANKNSLLKKGFIKRQFLAREMSKINHGPFGYGEHQFNALEGELKNVRSFENLLNNETLTGEDAINRAISLYNIGEELEIFPKEKSIESGFKENSPGFNYFNDPANRKNLLHQSFVKRQAFSKKLAQSKKNLLSDNDDQSHMEREIEMLNEFDRLLSNDKMTGQDAFFREQSLQNIATRFNLSI